MWFSRMAIEKESPEEYGYDRIEHTLGESAAPDHSLEELNVKLNLQGLVLCYGHHRGKPELREHIADQYEGCASTIYSSQRAMSFGEQTLCEGLNLFYRIKRRSI